LHPAKSPRQTSIDCLVRRVLATRHLRSSASRASVGISYSLTMRSSPRKRATGHQGHVDKNTLQMTLSWNGCPDRKDPIKYVIIIPG
jgi:hypothetical protein